MQNPRDPSRKPIREKEAGTQASTTRRESLKEKAAKATKDRKEEEKGSDSEVSRERGLTSKASQPASSSTSANATRRTRSLEKAVTRASTHACALDVGVTTPLSSAPRDMSDKPHWPYRQRVPVQDHPPHARMPIWRPPVQESHRPMFLCMHLISAVWKLVCCTTVPL